jgi:hypothetical protein
VFSLEQIRDELRCSKRSSRDWKEVEEETATELACVTMETTAALDARFRLVTARVLAKYTSGLIREKFDEETLRFRRASANGAMSEDFEFDVGSLVRLMRAAVGACYSPGIDRLGHGDVHVAPPSAGRNEMAPCVDVHRARYDERHEVAESPVLAPVRQVRVA